MMIIFVILKLRSLNDILEGPFSLVEDWLLRRAREGIILDFGCGKGLVMKRFSQRGWSSIGIDPKLDELRGAKMFGEAVCAVGEMLPFTNESVDVVVSSNVLHHMSNPQNGIKEIQRCLKCGGHLLLIETTDNNPIIRLARKIYPHYEEMPVKSRFMMEDLKALVVENYFTIVKEGAGGFLTWIFVMLIKRKRLLAKVFYVLLPGFEGLELYAVRKIRPLEKYAQTYFMLAYK